jgi:hypothetical protein
LKPSRSTPRPHLSRPPLRTHPGTDINPSGLHSSVIRSTRPHRRCHPRQLPSTLLCRRNPLRRRHQAPPGHRHRQTTAGLIVHPTIFTHWTPQPLGLNRQQRFRQGKDGQRIPRPITATCIPSTTIGIPRPRDSSSSTSKSPASSQRRYSHRHGLLTIQHKAEEPVTSLPRHRTPWAICALAAGQSARRKEAKALTFRVDIFLAEFAAATVHVALRRQE